MKRTPLRLLAVVGLTAWLSAPAPAQQRYPTASEGEMSMETELHNQFSGNASAGYESGCCCGSPAMCEAGCGCDDCGGTCGGFEPCCHSSGVWAEAEVTWFRYHRADGVRVGRGRNTIADNIPLVGGIDLGAANEDAEFDFEPTPRLTVGWVRDDGLGVRARYWEFDHNAPAVEAGSQLSVDTYNFDVEVFDTFGLNRNWDLEVAAGIRYTEFTEFMHDVGPTFVFPGIGAVSGFENRLNAFHGFGGMGSLELRRSVGVSGALFVRARAAILMDDKDISNTTLFTFNGAVFAEFSQQQVRLLDATQGMTELAFGYQYTTPIGRDSYSFVKVQAEWQNWYNFSSAFEDVSGSELFAGPADIGFGGFGLSAGIAR